MSNDISRRAFVAAMSAAPSVLPALGQNNRLRVGWIGAGGRGYHCINQMKLSSADMVDVVQVCDVYDGRLARIKDYVQTNWKTTPKATKEYREILADPNVDVVFIMTPEHLHYPMAMAALKANKHIYLEKPIAHTIEQGAEIVKLAEKTGKVVQVGTQNRSNKLYIRGKELVEQGMLGEVHYVRAFWYRNFDPKAVVNAAWRYEIPKDASPENTDFKRFLEGADNTKRDFSKERFFQWRNYWDYSGGISTDLLVHQTDISNFVLNKTVPSSCMASGGIYMWGKPDDREVPDTLSAVYEYPQDRFHLNYSCYFGNDHFGYGEEFLGSEGTLRVLNRMTLDYFPQKFPPQAAAAKPIKGRQEVHLHFIKDFNQPDATADHIHNFIMAVLGKEKAIAPARAGQIAAIPGHMATLSYKNNRKIWWDEKTEKYRYS